MSRDLAGHISDLITVAKEMRNDPSVDKQRLNKTISRLQDAQDSAEKIIIGKVNGVPNVSAPMQGSTAGCSCTRIGDTIAAIDVNCPVHKP